MTRPRTWLLTLLPILVLALPAQAKVGSSLEGKAFGEKLTLDPEETVLAAKVLKDPAAYEGKKLRLKGKGLPGPRPGQTGDQLVRLQVETPSQLSEEQRALLEQFEELSGGHIQSEPKRQSFLQSLKDFFDATTIADEGTCDPGSNHWYKRNTYLVDEFFCFH